MPDVSEEKRRRIDELLDAIRVELEKAGHWYAHITTRMSERPDGDLIRAEPSGFKVMTIEVSPEVERPAHHPDWQAAADKIQREDESRDRMAMTLLAPYRRFILHDGERYRSYAAGDIDWAMVPDNIKRQLQMIGSRLTAGVDLSPKPLPPNTPMQLGRVQMEELDARLRQLLDLPLSAQEWGPRPGTFMQVRSGIEEMLCPDCHGTRQYQPLTGPAESCKTCQPSGREDG